VSNKYLIWPDGRDEQIRVMEHKSTQPVKAHMHDFIEIVFFAHGSCKHTYHGTEATLIPGDAFVVVPHEEHSYEINSQTLIYNCLFYPEALGEDWKALKEIRGIFDVLMVEPFYRTECNHQEIVHLHPSEASHIQYILKKMLNEQEHKQPGYRLMQKANLITLLASLGRAWEKQHPAHWNSYTEKRNMLAHALNYIEQNISNDFSINDLAARVYLSPDYFRKVFRDITSLTPVEYINKMRVAKATQLLKETTCTIAEIAEMVGISDSNYFSRLFRSITGTSPSDLRKKPDLY
jgi:AraC-like DNA-binding protein/quercetin dioxygenase-like cupin family protein